MTPQPSTLPSTNGRSWQERQDRIVALRHGGKTWYEIAAAVGLSPSRARAIYASRVEVATAPVDDAAILSNIEMFARGCTNQAPTRRAYGQWSGRIVSPATIEHRFGSWQRAVDLAFGSKKRLDDADILDSLRAYQVKAGHRPTSRTYDAWEHRIAAHRAIEQRFGSWQRALELAFKSATTD